MIQRSFQSDNYYRRYRRLKMDHIEMCAWCRARHLYGQQNSVDNLAIKSSVEICCSKHWIWSVAWKRWEKGSFHSIDFFFIDLYQMERCDQSSIRIQFDGKRRMWNWRFAKVHSCAHIHVHAWHNTIECGHDWRMGMLLDTHLRNNVRAIALKEAHLGPKTRCLPFSWFFHWFHWIDWYWSLMFAYAQLPFTQGPNRI